MINIIDMNAEKQLRNYSIFNDFNLILNNNQKAYLIRHGFILIDDNYNDAEQNSKVVRFTTLENIAKDETYLPVSYQYDYEHQQFKFVIDSRTKHMLEVFNSVAQVSVNEHLMYNRRGLKNMINEDKYINRF